jgi:hypothetical protein
MMRLVKLAALAGIAAAAVLTLGAAQRPVALLSASPGLWEVSGVPSSRGPLRECLADLAVLAQLEHRGQRCNRFVVHDNSTSTVIHYSCTGGGFGQSKLTVITPRSLRIETQGISNNLPFNYVIQAHRIGDCPAKQSAAAH